MNPPDMNHLELLFNPESVAVVGASNDLTKWGAGIFARVLNSPSVKRPYPINNNADEVQGQKTYPSIRDLPETVDFVAIVVPYPGVPDVVRDCVDMGIKAGLIITAGLGEAGPEGVRLEREIITTAAKGGLRLVGPNCMGHFNTTNDFSTLRMGMPIERGGVGVISQSGGFAMHILRCGTEMGAGFSKFVSVGNEADLHFEDFFEYLGHDDDTKVITGYIEGLRKGRDFFGLASEITRKKPVVVVKVGKTSAGTKAARSHTSAIAGSDTIYNAMFKQTGVIRVNEVEELFDVASALLEQPLPKGNRVGILTGGGGFGCVTSDACEEMGLDVAPLSHDTIEKLNAILPDRWPHANPVDTVASGFVTYPCIWPLLEDENLDALIVVGGIGQMGMMSRMRAQIPSYMQQADSDGPSVAEQFEQMIKARQEQELKDLDKISEYIKKYQKPVIIYGRISEDMRNSPVFTKLRENGLSMYPTPERAARVLAHLVEYSRYLNHS